MIEKRRKLNSQQMRFIDGIIQGKNRTDAYIGAGYKIRNRHNASSAASRLYANPNVQQEIQRQEKATRQYNSHYLASLSQAALDELSTMLRKCDNDRVKLDVIKAILEYAGVKHELKSKGDPGKTSTLQEFLISLAQRNGVITEEH
ncbi:terminase small subunit [Candidatus Poribacteria bacterium]